ncbi:AraC family transcriptional regulator [Yersinia enterocolitica]|nr:AraC family transcriptional regulator [Yersinia enterocolitica]
MQMTETKKQQNYLKVRSHIIIATNSCHVNITKNKSTFSLNKGEYYFIEKDSAVTIEIIKIRAEEIPDFIELSQQDINDIIKIMRPFYYKLENLTKPDEHVFIIEIDSLSKELFKAIKKTSCSRLKLYKLACLFSKSQKPQLLFNSLVMSAAVSFSEKVRRLIETNTSIKWTLSLIAKEFHLSEIAIRKKLSGENTTFYQILLEVRMEKAAMLILKNIHQIGSISSMVGISSPSHFIKTFQLYYGVTPKQFLMRHR